MRIQKIPFFVLLAVFAAHLPLAAQDINTDKYIIRADNTRVASVNLDAALLNAKNKGDKASLFLTARNIMEIGQKLDDGQNRKNFSILVSNNLDSFLNIAQNPVGRVDLFNIIYGGVLPLAYFEASLADAASYKKIADIYENNYYSCINKPQQCDFDKAGPALMFVSAKNKKGTDYSRLSSLLANSSIKEEDRLKLLEYAIPVMAVNDGQTDLEAFIVKLAADSKPVKQVIGGHFDFFAFVNLADDAYQFVKNACSHKDSFVEGVCGQFGGDAPFIEYTKPVMPAEVKALIKQEKSDPKVLKIENFASAPQSPYTLMVSLRLYGALYDTQKDWNAALNFLLNLNTPADTLIVAARDIAMAQLAVNSASAPFRNYFAARLSNTYFTLQKNTEADALLKASLMNDAGIYYAKLKGYKGASPITVLSDSGYKAQIKFQDNEADIKGFLASMFNFEERPAEAFTNLLISGMVVKGIAKNSNKILGALGLAFKEGKNVLQNMPSVINRAKAQFKAAAYFASKEGGARLNFAYVNTGPVPAKAIGANRVGFAVEAQAFKPAAAAQPAAHSVVGAPPVSKAMPAAEGTGIVNKFKAVSKTPTPQAKQPAPNKNKMDDDIKRLGYGIMRKVLRMSPRAAIKKLYAWGAQPTWYQKLEYTGESYTIKNLDAFKITPADKAKGLPAFPKTTSKYLYRGMSLTSDKVKNVMVNGLRKIDMPQNNMAIMSSMATPGTNVQAISLSPYASESAQYSVFTAINNSRGIPTVVHVKGINKKNAAYNAHGYFTGKDIPAKQLVKTSALLNIDGKFKWGEVVLKDGNFLFLPYK